MKKSLLLAALFLSSAAQADTYVCDSKVWSILGMGNVIADEPEIQNQYILNTESETLAQTISGGDRVDDAKKKPQICNLIEHNLVCIEKAVSSFSSDNPLKQFALNVERGALDFVYTEAQVYAGVTIRTSIGSCSKI